MSHEIVVGNIGTVYCGTDEQEAQRMFEEYRHQSKAQYGRAAGESVTWFQDGEIYKETEYRTNV